MRRSTAQRLANTLSCTPPPSPAHCTLASGCEKEASPRARASATRARARSTAAGNVSSVTVTRARWSVCLFVRCCGGGGGVWVGTRRQPAPRGAPDPLVRFVLQRRRQRARKSRRAFLGYELGVAENSPVPRVWSGCATSVASTHTLAQLARSRACCCCSDRAGQAPRRAHTRSMASASVSTRSPLPDGADASGWSPPPALAAGTTAPAARLLMLLKRARVCRFEKAGARPPFAKDGAVAELGQRERRGSEAMACELWEVELCVCWVEVGRARARSLVVMSGAARATVVGDGPSATGGGASRRRRLQAPSSWPHHERTPRRRHTHTLTLHPQLFEAHRHPTSDWHPSTDETSPPNRK